MMDMKTLEGKEVTLHSVKRPTLCFNGKIEKVEPKEIQFTPPNRFPVRIAKEQIYKIRERSPVNSHGSDEIIWINKKELNKKKEFVKKADMNIFAIGFCGFLIFIGIFTGMIMFRPEILNIAYPNMTIWIMFGLASCMYLLFLFIRWNPYKYLIKRDWTAYCEIEAGLVKQQREW